MAVKYEYAFGTEWHPGAPSEALKALLDEPREGGSDWLVSLIRPGRRRIVWRRVEVPTVYEWKLEPRIDAPPDRLTLRVLADGKEVARTVIGSRFNRMERRYHLCPIEGREGLFICDSNYREGSVTSILVSPVTPQLPYTLSEKDPQ